MNSGTTIELLECIGLRCSSLMPSPLLAHARKGLVKRVTFPCPEGSNMKYQSGCSKVVTRHEWNIIINLQVVFAELVGKSFLAFILWLYFVE